MDTESLTKRASVSGKRRVGVRVYRYEVKPNRYNVAGLFYSCIMYIM